MQFFLIPNRTMCLSKKIYTNTFFALLRAASPLKTFYVLLYSTKNLKEIILNRKIN